MKTLLLVTDIFPPDIGGPATFIDALAHAAVEHGVKVSVVCLTERRREDSDKERPFRVLRLLRHERRTFQIITALLEAEMRSHEAVLVNGLELMAAAAAHNAGKSYLLKIVGDYVWENARNNHLTNMPIDEFQQVTVRPEWLAEGLRNRQFYLRGADHIVVPSQYLARLVGGWGMSASKISVIYNGIDAASHAGCEPRPRANEPFTVGFCGRLVNWKGVDTLLEAARALPGVHVKIFGDGPERINLETLAGNFGLTERVFFTGTLAKAQLGEELGRCHALVLGSQYEGLSHTLLEAAAMGVARVASDCCGNPEVVTHGKDGLLVPFGNPEALIAALSALADDEALRLGLAREGLSTAARFPFADTVAQTLALLESRQVGSAQGHERRPIISSFGGTSYLAREADQFAVGEVFHEGEYDFIRSLNIPENPVIVDMGANIGLFSLYCFRQWPKAHVEAFEPCQDTFAVLAGNQGLNGSYDWHIHSLGGWSSDTTLRFVNAESSTSGRLDPELGQEEVSVIGLRTLLATYASQGLDILKVDIEGAEEAFLCEDPELLSNIQHLIVEIHPYRCDASHLESVLQAQFPHVYAIQGRRSSKPLLLASRREYPLSKHIPTQETQRQIAHGKPESGTGESMRITHVINLGEYPGFAPFSGAENHLFVLMRALVERGHYVEFAPIVYSDGPALRAKYSELEEAGIRVFPMDCSKMQGVDGERRSIELMRQFFVSRTNHIVHTHLDPADYIARVAARLAGCTMIMSSVHNNEPHYEQPHWRRQLQVLDHFNEKYIAISSSVRDCLVHIGVPPEKIEVIYYGLTLPEQVLSKTTARHRLGLSPEAFVVGYVGRLEPQKNLPLLLTAMRHLPDMECVLVGGGSQREELESLAMRMGLTNVRFAGYVPDAADLMPAFDIFCLPSLWEGLGLVLVEAMLRNVPVLGSRAGAIPDVLKNGEAGILFSQDSLQELVTSLKIMRSKRFVVNALAKKAKAYALARFNLAAMVDSTETLYRNMYQAWQGKYPIARAVSQNIMSTHDSNTSIV